MIRHFVNFILLILPPSRLFYIRRLLLKLANIEIDHGACFCGGGWIYGSGRLVIGKNTWISPSTVFYTHQLASIRIGDLCDIGPEVSFITGSHKIGKSLRRAGEGQALPIQIGNGCWIGARSVILGGVSVGAGSIIAAGSVVTNNVPENVLVAGVPAKIKKELDSE